MSRCLNTLALFRVMFALMLGWSSVSDAKLYSFLHLFVFSMAWETKSSYDEEDFWCWGWSCCSPGKLRQPFWKPSGNASMNDHCDIGRDRPRKWSSIDSSDQRSPSPTSHFLDKQRSKRTHNFVALTRLKIKRIYMTYTDHREKTQSLA